MKVDSISMRITLRDGMSMPLFGLGCWAMRDRDSVYNSINTAVNDGYRLFDTAQNYRNESAVGKALQDCGLKREEYFVVTKLFSDHPGYNSAKENLAISLKKLGLDYVDLYLIHTPRNGKIVETWKAFMELKEAGLTKSIGVSNFNIHHLQPLIDAGMEIPSVNQIEMHPWNQYKSTVKFCCDHNIAVMGYCPLARCRFFRDGLYPDIDNISKKHGKSKPQIILRWAVQSGFVTIPKSENKGRIKENGDLFSWSLNDDEMMTIDNLDNGIQVSNATSAMFSQWLG